jgi:acetyltransferase
MATSSRQSIRSRFRSFFEKTTHQMAVQYCVIDYEREMAIVAQSEVDRQPKLIGVANLLADANHEEAEFAVIIADPWQGKGLGGRLLDYCLELAARWGIKRIVAETEPTNKLMLAVFRSRGFRSEVCYDDSTVYLEKKINGVK